MSVAPNMPGSTFAVSTAQKRMRRAAANYALSPLLSRVKSLNPRGGLMLSAGGGPRRTCVGSQLQRAGCSSAVELGIAPVRRVCVQLLQTWAPKQGRSTPGAGDAASGTARDFGPRIGTCGPAPLGNPAPHGPPPMWYSLPMSTMRHRLDEQLIAPYSHTLIKRLDEQSISHVRHRLDEQSIAPAF